MPYKCELCGKEFDLKVNPNCYNGSQSYVIGVICKNHNHDDIYKVIDLTVQATKRVIQEQIKTKVGEAIWKFTEDE
jgi:hypothetical protein